ncbi:MAG: Rrf2 family transcriptional regulator [Candidatus Gracilibacteria bacterium]
MLKLSKKGGYAVRAVIFIAKKSEIIKVSDISREEKISESLLRRIIADLEKKEILHTIKGRNGGVELGREVKKISIYDILDAVGEELSIRDCSTGGILCDNKENCSTERLYGSLQKGFNSLLKIHTLDKLI